MGTRAHAVGFIGAFISRFQPRALFTTLGGSSVGPPDATIWLPAIDFFLGRRACVGSQCVLRRAVARVGLAVSESSGWGDRSGCGIAPLADEAVYRFRAEHQLAATEPARESPKTPQRFPSRNMFFIYGNPADVSLCHGASAAQRRPCVFSSGRWRDERLE